MDIDRNTMKTTRRDREGRITATDCPLPGNPALHLFLTFEHSIISNADQDTDGKKVIIRIPVQKRRIRIMRDASDDGFIPFISSETMLEDRILPPKDPFSDIDDDFIRKAAAETASAETRVRRLYRTSQIPAERMRNIVNAIHDSMDSIDIMSRRGHNRRFVEDLELIARCAFPDSSNTFASPKAYRAYSSFAENILTEDLLEELFVRYLRNERCRGQEEPILPKISYSSDGKVTISLKHRALDTRGSWICNVTLDAIALMESKSSEMEILYGRAYTTTEGTLIFPTDTGTSLHVTMTMEQIPAYIIGMMPYMEDYVSSYLYDNTTPQSNGELDHRMILDMGREIMNEGRKDVPEPDDLKIMHRFAEDIADLFRDSCPGRLDGIRSMRDEYGDIHVLLALKDRRELKATIKDDVPYVYEGSTFISREKDRQTEHLASTADMRRAFVKQFRNTVASKAGHDRVSDMDSMDIYAWNCMKPIFSIRRTTSDSCPILIAGLDQRNRKLVRMLQSLAGFTDLSFRIDICDRDLDMVRAFISDLDAGFPNSRTVFNTNRILPDMRSYSIIFPSSELLEKEVRSSVKPNLMVRDMFLFENVDWDNTLHVRDSFEKTVARTRNIVPEGIVTAISSYLLLMNNLFRAAPDGRMCDPVLVKAVSVAMRFFEPLFGSANELEYFWKSVSNSTLARKLTVGNVVRDL